MGMIIGPTPWWQLSLISTCPVGTTLPDGSRIICKAGGTAWIVAPSCTQVSATWANSAIVGTGSTTGDLPSVSCWATLNTALLNNGFNPADWFVPSSTQLLNPGYTCRTQWDTFSSAFYWSSTECSATNATWAFGGGCTGNSSKTCACCVRAFRCVTY
jgi:hypothetical protein